jgi:hypothetical protein
MVVPFMFRRTTISVFLTVTPHIADIVTVTPHIADIVTVIPGLDGILTTGAGEVMAGEDVVGIETEDSRW